LFILPRWAREAIAQRAAEEAAQQQGHAFE
jgi:hypothetical protein